MKKRNKPWHNQSLKNKTKHIKNLPMHLQKKISTYQKIPKVFADRIQKMSILSFFILFSGSFMGVQMKSIRYIFWSVCISGMVFAQTLFLLYIALNGRYEVVEGIVLEILEKYPFRKMKKIRLRLFEGGETFLLLERHTVIEIGVKYRFYFKCSKGPCTGIKSVDTASNIGSFYGFEKITQE